MGVPACALFVAQLWLMGDSVAAGFLAVVTALIASTPWVVARSGSAALGANLCGAAVYVGAVGLSLRQGGVTSPTLPWLVTGPFLLLVCEQQAYAFGWFVADVVTVALFWTLDLELPGGLYGRDGRPVPDWLVATSTAGLFAVLMLHLGLVERARRAAAKDLEAANAELRAGAAALAEQNSAGALARDEALAAVRAKASFLSTMSHELRTPLNGVIGAAELLSDSDGPQRDELLSTVRLSGTHLLWLVSDILDYASLDGGADSELARDHVVLSRLVADAADGARAAATTKGLELRVSVAPNIAPRVVVDSARLAQVLRRLLHNAVKFTAAGSVQVVVRLDQTRLVFEVHDTGVGIDEPTSARLFAAFAQADSSDTRAFGGLGLGLAVSRALVSLMGGAITLHSAPGDGSTFAFTVPYEPADEPTDKPAVVAESVAGVPPLGRVLVVEDDAVNQRLVRAMTQRLGATEVAIVPNGAAGVETWAQGQWDLVLMDCQMPVMDGFEATRRIRALERETGSPHVPIIALTAGVLPADRARCGRAGMDGYLGKPYTLTQLGEVIANTLATVRASASESA